MVIGNFILGIGGKNDCYINPLKTFSHIKVIPDTIRQYRGKSIPINYRYATMQEKVTAFSIKDKDFIDEIIDRYIDIDNYKWFNLFKEDNLNRNERLIEIKS